jgi:hypothetical protein
LDFEIVISLGGGGNGDDVVDVYREDDGALRGSPMIYAPLTRDAKESPLAYSSIERPIPDAACLFHAVDALHKAHYPSFLARGFETGGLFHEHSLGVGQDAVEEGGFNVILLDVPIERGTDVEDATEGLKASSGCRCFIIVDTIPLRVSFGNITYFVPDNVPRVISFPLAHKFALQRALATWDSGAGDKYEDPEIFETANLISGTSDPILSFRRSKCFWPEGIVIWVRFRCGDDGAIWEGKESVVYGIRVDGRG